MLVNFIKPNTESIRTVNDAGVPLTLRNLLFKPGTKCGIIRCKAQYAGLVYKKSLNNNKHGRKLYLMKIFKPINKKYALQM